MRFFALAIMASTALLPASVLAQTALQPRLAAPEPTRQDVRARPVAVSDLEGRDVFTARGENVGQVEGVLLGQGNQPFVVISFDEFLGLGGESRIVPLSAVSLQNDQLVIRTMGQAEARALPRYRADLTGYREAEPADLAQIPTALAGQDVQAEGSRIVVQQAAPQVRVEQAQPQVTVQQVQPNVTVRQPEPEIIVRQIPPTIRLQQPQPEIIVRMPEPDVNVAMAQPQVQVRQPRPEVQVQQGDAGQVQIEREQARAQVQVLPTEREADVQIQRAQPTVRFERTGEPRIVYQEAQGQPIIRFERQGQEVQANAPARVTDPAALGGTIAPPPPEPAVEGQAAGASIYTEEQRRTVRDRLVAGDTTATGAIGANAPMRPVAIADLEDRGVYNARGDELGEVDRVIVTPQGRRFVVVAAGGFLGLGQDRVAFPLERFWMRGDRLVIRGVTEEDIERMDDYRDALDRFQRVSRNERTNLRVWQ